MEEEEIDVARARLYIPDEYLIPGTATRIVQQTVLRLYLMLAKASGWKREESLERDEWRGKLRRESHW